MRLFDRMIQHPKRGADCLSGRLLIIWQACLSDDSGVCVSGRRIRLLIDRIYQIAGAMLRARSRSFRAWAEWICPGFRMETEKGR